MSYYIDKGDLLKIKILLEKRLDNYDADFNKKDEIDYALMKCLSLIREQKSYKEEFIYKIRKVNNYNIKKVINDCINLYGDSADLNWLDVSEVTDMSNLFEESEFSGDISKWDVSNVTNMSHMFAKSFFDGDISNWNVSKVEDMSYMFNKNTFFYRNISKWDVSNVKNMEGMFKETCFNKNLSSWNVKKVKFYKNFNSDSYLVKDNLPKFK